ncbi:MAG: adenosylcobinamide-GDP ribazoletransferase [Methanoregulaceae archaeon]|nr:adenosylcobinamide-GDP ribazoletransferase [Methanoregulaceae archaeon]
MKALIALLQFATILPLGKPRDLEHFARHSYLYPLAGYVIGGLVAIMVFWIPSRTIAAGIAVAGVLFLSGCNHFDGLLDFGDAIMAQGDREKRIRALTDHQVGAGGVAIGIAITLLLFAGLQASVSIAAAVLIGEVCAKFSMALLTTIGTPFQDGTHSYFHSFSHPYFPLIAFVLCIPLIFLRVSVGQLATAGILMVLCPTVLLLISKRLFGGVNGDVVGASNEITRAFIILCMAIVA